MASRRGLSTSSSESESDDKTKRKMKTHNKSEIETSDSDVSISEEKGYPFEVDGYEMKKLEQKGYIFNGVILGTGSFGVIYECIHQGHKLACKKYHIQMAMERNNDFDEVEFLQEIENEIQILNVINHPNCIKLYSVERMHKTPSSTPQSSPRGSSKGTPKQSPKELNRQQRKETLKESPASSTSSRTTSTSISSAVSLTQSTTLLFTERCHGDFKRFKRDFGTNNALNEDQNGKWFVQITMALKYLHWGDKEFKDGTEKNAPIMFWDLHEGNILFKGTVPGTLIFKLTDFGLSTIIIDKSGDELREFLHEDVEQLLGVLIRAIKGYADDGNDTRENKFRQDIQDKDAKAFSKEHGISLELIDVLRRMSVFYSKENLDTDTLFQTEWVKQFVQLYTQHGIQF